MERDLLNRGMVATGDAGSASIVILNTCTVTASADQDVRSAIRRIHRNNPGCRILVTGCYAQRAPEEIARIPGVSAVIGNSHKQHVAGIATSAPGFVALTQLSPGLPPGGPDIYVGDIFAHTQLTGATVFEVGARTRPNLKIQDGCNNRCSFCIIPFVRGHSRSLPLEEAIREVQELVAAGYREVVISGINLGRWGRDLPAAGGPPARPPRFDQLVRAILERTALPKLRISSVEATDWTAELISLVAGSSRIAKHAHVPLQSGSDRILRLMHRKYRPWHYVDRIERIHAAMPQAAIGADVMVGFPGETDEDFEQTRALIERLPFTYLHVFTYSSRPGTPSAAMPAAVAPAVMKERNRILRELAAGKHLRFMQCFVGQTIDAITLHVQEDGCTEALTDNYLKLRLAGHHAANQWVTAQVAGAAQDALSGSVVTAATAPL